VSSSSKLPWTIW